ncbi:hypothetical protein QJS10_CPB13g00415 [Acorus calamus]|uniref:Uncharacterized protein n=1 Tax=Acorus calamus TaxID=4465 RepID=A0AAV9DEU8_ACOCL|nr:hypothetical protein QJS10_CPB13g00415 [Acorus calamus]
MEGEEEETSFAIDVGFRSSRAWSVSPRSANLVHHVPVESATVMLMSRKLKENHYDMHVTKNKGDIGNVEVEDYPHFDPAPSSKAAIRYAPIEHGTPLMPYVPKPSPPPGHPKHNGLA